MDRYAAETLFPKFELRISFDIRVSEFGFPAQARA